MKIIQLLPTLHGGDAVGNDAIAMHKLLREMGHETVIYAEEIGHTVPAGIAKPCQDLGELGADDVILYHYSIGSEIMEEILRKVPGKKVMVYHNVTPGAYFDDYNEAIAEIARAGRENLKEIQPIFSACFADSGYNKQDLIKAGYRCPIAVLPILIPFEDYLKPVDETIVQTYGKDDFTNILFVGRLAPNKKIEDVIRAFAYYKKYLNARSRLFLVGSPLGMDPYVDRLRRYVDRLFLQNDIFFSGKVPFDQILAYYKIADLFLCMSEHEGFCVPLAEAMSFSVPIVARSAAAVPETLGGAGLLVNGADPAEAARAMDRIVGDAALAEQLRQAGKKRLEDFSYEKTAALFQQYLEQVVKGEGLDSDTWRPQAVGPDGEDSGARENCRKQGLSTDVLAFEDIPKTAPLAKPPKDSFRHRVKVHVLKPAYNFVAKVSPGAAEAIRIRIYHMLQKMKDRKREKMEQQMEVLERTEPGLLVDVTQTARSDAGTGIQRVVNKAFQNLYCAHPNILAVRDSCGKLITAEKYLRRMEGSAAEEREKLIEFLDGDKLLLLDSSWEFHKDFSGILTEAHARGIESHGIVYDLFPIQYPELFDSKLFVELFTGWHNMLMQQASSVVCISKTTADVVAAYYEKKKFHRDEPLRLYYFHMGADIAGGTQEAREEIRSFVRRKTTFLMVGTVEPRKGHAVAVEAFRKLLVNADAQLLVLGHNGWKNEEFIRSLKGDERLSQNFLWVKDAADEELRWAYANANALIAASKDEGFGLPLIEAAYFGMPIICSDIPIFREVTQGHADYFKAMDADALAEKLAAWLQAESHPDSRKIHIYTWQEASEEIMDIIYGKTEPYKVLG